MVILNHERYFCNDRVYYIQFGTQILDTGRGQHSFFHEHAGPRHYFKFVSKAPGPSSPADCLPSEPFSQGVEVTVSAALCGVPRPPVSCFSKLRTRVQVSGLTRSLGRGGKRSPAPDAVGRRAWWCRVQTPGAAPPPRGSPAASSGRAGRGLCVHGLAPEPAFFGSPRWTG